MFKSLSIVLTCALIVSSLFLLLQPQENKLQSYLQWKSQFGLRYEPYEDIYRLHIFLQTLQLIQQHNSKDFTYKMGINKFTAMTDQEFREKYLEPQILIQKRNIQNMLKDILNGPSIDWVEAGAVTPVKDQGQCISTYAFATVGGIEALSAISFGKPDQYSVQQLIDCSQFFDNKGCKGGALRGSYQYVTSVQVGIFTQKQYPFTSKDGTCKEPKKNDTGFIKIRDYSFVEYNCFFLAQQLMKTPISVSVDGTNFKTYKQGIFSNCGKSTFNTYALLVGMTDNFWKLKMSWGTGWGENGYIRLSRGDTCGVCDNGFYPIK